jgi:hypothetical protein
MNKIKEMFIQTISTSPIPSPQGEGIPLLLGEKGLGDEVRRDNF